MTTLAKRATPSQVRIMRAVEGAVLNTGHAHPDWNITPQLARSVAKRAAGTLSSQWLGVLAARSVSSGQGPRDPATSRRGSQLVRAKGASVSPIRRRSPLLTLWKKLSIMAGEAKRSNRQERLEVIIEVLRLVAGMQEKT